MNNKQRLETILKGGVPDVPPHFELLFQLQKPVFGQDPDVLDRKHFSSHNDWAQAILDWNLESAERLADEYDWAAFAAPYYIHPEFDAMRSIRYFKEKLADKMLVFSFCDDGVFWMPSGGDIMEFVLRMCHRPEEMHAEARQKCETAKARLRRQAEAGVDFIIHNTDFGFNTGPFISPPQFAEFVTPYMTEIVETCKELKVPVILHSDGDLNLILDQIHSTGIDGYQSVDPQGGMDIKAVREQYPDWILMGNVNCSMLQDVNEEKIREGVRYCMEHGGVGQRYIFSTSNCIFDGMPIESYRIMLDEYRQLCRKATAGQA